MFSTLGLFKNLDCPEGTACSYKTCLFSHKDTAQVNDATQHKALSAKRRLHSAQQDDIQLGKDLADEIEHPRVDVLRASQAQPTQSSCVGSAKPQRSISPPKLKSKLTARPSNPLALEQNEKPKTTSLTKTTTTSVQFARKEAITAPKLSPKQDDKAEATALRKSTTSVQLLRKDPPANPKPPPRSEPLLPRPMQNSPATIPIRSKLLKVLHGEFDRLNKLVTNSKDTSHRPFLLSSQALIVLALEEEINTAKENPMVYTNVLKNRIGALKRFSLSSWIKERKTQMEKTCIAEGPPSKKRKLTSMNERVKTGLKPEQEIAILPHLAASPKALLDHGYITIIPTDTEILKARAGVEVAQRWEECDRCGTRFRAFPKRQESDGTNTTGGACRHHWGRLGPQPRNLGSKAVYSCCQLAEGELGCEVKPSHVFKVSNPARLASILQFEATPTHDLAESLVPVAFDCEMAYTSYGMELIRLTATAWPSGNPLLDVLVRPKGDILDLNTRFSGVTVDQWTEAEPWNSSDLPPVVRQAQSKRAKTESDTDIAGGSAQQMTLPMIPSLQHARSLLFQLISPSTPLIGHALENDLIAVRIVHPMIVDTVVLYPHRRGLPIRNKLKFLAQDEINWSIQNSTTAGHNSLEDALAAGELVRKKITIKWLMMQKAGWKFEGNELHSPQSRT